MQGLEEDALFRSWVRWPLWRDVTRKLIGERVGINRAMYFAKPAATEGVRIDWVRVTFAPQLVVYLACNDLDLPTSNLYLPRK